MSEAYAYDEEFTVILSDWYHEQHSVLLAQFISQANPGGAEPVPDSAIMYFAQNGSYLSPAQWTNGSVGDSAPSTIGFSENSTLPFTPGKTYRLRVINQSAFSMFFFWIEGHDMRVIEVDGVSSLSKSHPQIIDHSLYRPTLRNSLRILSPLLSLSDIQSWSPRGTIQTATGLSTRTWSEHPML